MGLYDILAKPTAILHKIPSIHNLKTRLAPFAFGFAMLLIKFLFSNCAIAQAKKEGKSNIIFISADDLGYSNIGVFFQNARALERNWTESSIFTPNLDRMEKAVTVLNQSYSAAPVCVHSCASKLLFQCQAHANVHDNQFSKVLAYHYTLRNIFRKAGYKTEALGEFGVQGDKQSAHSLKRWLDYYYGYIGHGEGYKHYPKEGKCHVKKRIWENEFDVSEEFEKCYTVDLWTG